MEVLSRIMMKIGIDASSLTIEKATGVENYVRNLVLSLNKIKSNDLFSLYTPAKFYNFPKLNPNFAIIKKSALKYWSQLQLPRMISKDRPDVVLFPSNIVAPFLSSKIVYHFHDLAWMIYPKAYSNSMRLRQLLAIKRAKKRADRIIVSSQSSKIDLIKYFKFNSDKITIIPFGYNESIKSYRTDLSSRSGIIFVGRLEHRKNIINMIKAYKLYASSIDNPETLHLVGHPGFGFDEINTELSQATGSGYKIIWHRSLIDEEYYRILGQSKIMLFPTLYEGFGLPILEAFAAGTAVISSDASSIPEITGDGALLTDPKDIDQISKLLKMLLLDNKLRFRLIKNADLELAKYSWEKCARETLKLLENVARQT